MSARAALRPRSRLPVSGLTRARGLALQDNVFSLVSLLQPKVSTEEMEQPRVTLVGGVRANASRPSSNVVLESTVHFMKTILFVSSALS